MQIGLKLLLYLNPDEAHIDDMAMYLYGKANNKTRSRTQQIVGKLRRNGWKISDKSYKLDPKHCRLVQKIKHLEKMPGRVPLRPSNIGKRYV